jgi:hypothetical protein
MIHTPVNSNLKFMGLDVCWCSTNYILEFKDKTEGKNQVIAEARFLRAYYHLN